ncbi:hypothetical protein [Metabacillus rhizolycopersici]|uniref:Glycosyltransferase RgtA/B/C/D-like domain-containing protein n=1 Tax=Metabacillus rhizolycopersici TaxID=2875709 RepID=A0ABS7UX24_9BACI|nr:hypothetical protein [Metabacillus rhizolycopersici]MBZ5752851.1 hypothetical protein [Metabacillus rhizolycopersici]
MLKRSIFVIFLFVISIIIGLNLFSSRGHHSIGLITPDTFNFITLIGACIGIALVLVFKRQIIDMISKIHSVFLVAAVLLFSVFLQLAVIRLFGVNPSWDFGVIVNSAKHLLATGELTDYFIKYPNNILLVSMLALVGKIFTPDLLIYQAVNVVLITLSQYFIYRITSKVAGHATGVLSLFVSVSFFPYIFFAPIVYTDTISLLFLLIPLNLLIDRNGDFRNHLFIIITASIFFSLGMILKGSLIIFIIALSIVLFIFQKKWKKTLFILPLLTLLIVKLCFNFFIYESGMIDKQQVQKYSFPVTHWIVMGQNDVSNGKYLKEDFLMTDQLLKTTTREQVREAHLNELMSRLKEKGWKGNIQFIIQKLTHTWTDGTYYSLNKLKRDPIIPENFTRLVDFKSGQLVLGYARIQHIILLAGLFFIARLKNQNEFFTFSMLAVIGFFLFFILWEARSRYLVSLTPLLIMISCIGYFGINKKQAVSSENEKKELHHNTIS